MKHNRIFIVTFLALFLTVSLAYSFELPDGQVTTYELNVRHTADANGSVFYKLRKGQTVKIKAINGEWYKVRLDNGKEGYVHNKYLDVIVWARVQAPDAKIHAQPVQAAPGIGDMRGIEWVRIINKSRDWYMVELTPRVRGWVSGGALEAPEAFFSAWLEFQHGAPQTDINMARAMMASRTIRRGFAMTAVDTSEPPPTRNDSVPAGSMRYQIVEFAKKYIGTPYVYGGSSPRGFDCSGFVSYVYKNFDIKLPRMSSSQAGQGQYIPNGKLMPGDLVFFDTSGRNNGRVSHAGLYIGNGNFIHSSNSNGHAVGINSLDTGYWKRAYVNGRRFF